MIKFLLSVLLVLPSLALSKVETISADALLAQQAQNKTLVILDVRTTDEFLQGHVPGAINISHDELEKKINTLMPYQSQPIVVYCRSGRRAKLAIDILEKAGFEKIYHLAGDMNQWRAENRPIEK